MLPLRIQSEIQRIDQRIEGIEAVLETVDFALVNILSGHVVLSAAGLVEQSAAEILGEYTRRHGNELVTRFVQRSVGRNNSLNCEKLQSLLDQFDTTWWQDILRATTAEERSAVDSLKTLRDQIAHGKQNGTGFVVTKKYYQLSKRFITKCSDLILP